MSPVSRLLDSSVATAGSLLAVIGTAHAQTSEQPVETVSEGDAVIMGLFLVIASLIVISILCQLLIAFGLVPINKKSRLRRVIYWFAEVVGQIRVKSGKPSRHGSSSSGSSRGGGGSSGGGGASGDF